MTTASAISRRTMFRTIGFLVLALPLLASCGYGAVPAAEADAKSAWTEVNKQYRHRAETVQLLAGVLNGFPGSDKEALKAVTEALVKAAEVAVGEDKLSESNLVRQFQQTQAVLSASVDRLLASAAGIPEIKADPNFVSLLSNLQASAKAISIARNNYIDAARIHNTALRTMPTLFWAKLFNRGSYPFETLTFRESSALPQAPDSGS